MRYQQWKVTQMSIIISGASGQLGRRVTQLLLDRADHPGLILVTRSPDQLREVAGPGVEVRAGDFTDPAGLVEAFRGGERLLLISTDAEPKMAQHRNAVQAATAAGVRFVAYTSFANPTEQNPAAVASDHRETERLLRESGMEWAFLRNAMYAEMQVHSAHSALASGSLIHNAGDGRVAYVSREDCAAVAAAVIAGNGHAGRIYEVTGPEALSSDELAALYGEIGGRAVAPIRVDDQALVDGMVGSGLPLDLAELLASFGRSAREDQLETVSGSVRDLTGQAPRTLRSVLERHRDVLTAAAYSVSA